jgi:hypothetical protein
MHVSAKWIVKEYFDSAGFWEGWRGFIQMSGMLKSISIITHLLSMVLHFLHSEDLL